MNAANVGKLIVQVGLLPTEVFFCCLRYHTRTFTSDPLPPLASILFENEYKSKYKIKRLRWSRGSVLAFGTQVRGLKPGRSLRIFQGEKNPQHGFLRKGSKAVCLMS